MSNQDDKLTTDFIVSELKKVLARGIAFQTIREEDDFTLEVFLPDTKSAKKAQDLWRGLTGEPEKPQHRFSHRGNIYGHREPVMAFYFEDFGKNQGGAQFLKTVGPDFKVIACTADAASKAHSVDPESWSSREAQDYRMASEKFMNALDNMTSPIHTGHR